MEFLGEQRVIVNPLRIKSWVKNELENSLVLYYLGASRDSAKIITEQIKNVQRNDKESIQAMIEMKEKAYDMKEAILKGDFNAFTSCLNAGWNAKKRMAEIISNKEIDQIYDYILENGGKAAKISGAGGGGFMMIIVNPTKKFELIEALKKKGGTVS